jgi:HK97 family phage prohead protease
MPYHVARSDQCPASQPFATLKTGTGEVMGCHATQHEAQAQMAALYANEPMARTGGTVTGQIHYRTYTAELELSKGDGRTIFGIAVPYGVPAKIPHEGIVERFAYGAFAKQVRSGVPTRVPFTRGHVDTGGSVIGITRLLREDPAGLYGEWEVARTRDGEDALELYKMGLYRNLSIGFDEGHNRQVGGIVERVTSTLREVAMVLKGAYGELAMAQGLRSMPVEPYEPEPSTPNLDQARKLLASLPRLS